MKKMLWNLGCVAILVALTLSGCNRPVSTPTPAQTPEGGNEMQIILPEPRLKSDISLEEALHQRRSTREYTGEGLSFADISQLMWAAQGITSDWGGRTAPSAGALYPLEVYIAAGNVENLSPGVYKYKPDRHELVKVKNDDVRAELAEAALNQAYVEEGAIDIIIAAVYDRTTKKYGERGVRYVHMEAGHAAQNIYLQASALDLGMVTIGAFSDDRVKEIVGMSEDESPLYVIPVGRKG
jgi:SagB-type dehydrogenase family enzyme